MGSYMAEPPIYSYTYIGRNLTNHFRTGWHVHLVGEQDGDPELVGEPQQHPEEPGEVHLTGAELTTSGIVRAIQGRGAVHLQEQPTMN